MSVKDTKQLEGTLSGCFASTSTDNPNITSAFTPPPPPSPSPPTRTASKPVLAWLSQVESPLSDSSTLLSFPASTVHASKRRLGKLDSSDSRQSNTNKRQRRNLEDISANMVGRERLETTVLPQTPSSKSTDGISNRITCDASTNESGESDLNSYKGKKDSHAIGIMMAQHGLFQGDRLAYNRHPTLQTKVKKIIGVERESAMKPSSIRRMQEKKEYYGRLNEDTIMLHLFPLVAKDTRTVKPDFDHNEHEQSQGAGYLDREWFDDGLVKTVNVEFGKTLLPSKFAAINIEAEMTKALAKISGMKNPKPDYLFGIRVNRFPVPPDVIVTAETTALLEISKGTHHPFLIVEGKADRGSIAEAENQACRGGATLVNAARRLRTMVSQPEVVGADERTFVFSCVMSPFVIEVRVHWCEVKANNECEYHMNVVASSSINDDEGLIRLRRVLHNILEWGCIDRYKELEHLHAELYEYERVRWGKFQPSSSPKKWTLSPKKRKLDDSTAKSTESTQGI